MSVDIFNRYLEAIDVLRSQEYLESIYAYNFTDLKEKSRRKIQKRWEKAAYSWLPKKKVSLDEAFKIVGGALNG